MTNDLFIPFFIIGVLLMLSLSLSCLAMIFNLKAYVVQKSIEKSTHTIEYRDPFKEYPDEQILEKDDDGEIKLTLDNEEEEDVKNIDDLNTYLNKNKDEFII